MYTIYANANAAERNVKIITDHTGSDGLSNGRKIKFIKKVPTRGTNSYYMYTT